MIKKILICLLVTIFIVSLGVISSGCRVVTTDEAVASQTTAAAETTKAAETTAAATVKDNNATGLKQFNIVFVIAGVDAPFCAPYMKGYQDAAKAYGQKLEIKDGKWDANVVNNLIEDAVAAKVDAIAVNPIDSVAVVPAVEEAIKAKVPIMGSWVRIGAKNELYPGTFAYVGIDEWQRGFAAGNLMLKALPDGGGIVLIEGTPGMQAVNDRRDGFLAAIKSNPKIEVLGQQATKSWGREEATKIMENFIQANGDKIKGLYAQDDNMAIGGLLALEEAGMKDVKAVGIGGSKEGIKAILDGKMYGTVYDQPYEAGVLAFTSILNYLLGVKFPDEIIIKNPLVTIENASLFPGEW
ncbi:MAG: sugar ABC transporter substrate-binding protein [Actinobacteria bacterium]|nr:sugar ABC transporter substrate-binding protein [Cyanobacteriota bacterium]MCL5772151.1 sugar ABC transporter substrate-binding protein [Actinomycetota bacterium]